ncbi:GNAT family N-acetyltransferase [Tepidimicrobium xylanilyticum]|uniref:Protein N-acetyltransferase, RimJ/RimL family n=1 Tax=Tepidimicrobium xylanilyticum TaxID=1123352 RepID=A0A1H3BYU4_9FIRM|nr:GNAT family N-acetyltransferase [Tepidimicrobium xylanilyticum]GMG97296.1 N-acetyltransferase [Tepidimicrobium xylanilyticum]SDX47087.1 Protein N-acetyltransferase, RimJ/RimL family [Tepidimicrobium xylanilyticum]
MFQDLKISKARKEDAQKVLEFLNIVGGESDNLLFGENEFKNMPVKREMEIIENINSSDKSVMFVGKIGEEIVSIGSLQGLTGRTRIAHRGRLAISVKKKYWNQGIGTKMMEELIAFAKDIAKLEVIELEVRSDNLSAIRLYEKFGFKRIGLYKKYFKIGEEYFDALLMNLYL